MGRFRRLKDKPPYLAFPSLNHLGNRCSQRNYRQIYEDRMRFIAAAAMTPARQEQLKKVLEDMQTIEAAIVRGQEIAKRGDYAGAWEAVERVLTQFPDDNKLNQVRATLTT
jgi:ribosomal protein L18